MLNDMMKQMMQAQHQNKDLKNRLATITLVGEAQGVSVEIDGNRKIKNISPEDIFEDKEVTEDLLVTAVNRAIEQADNLNQTEMAAMAQQMLGGMNFPGA
jgi:DNA-binding protein YbaB